MVLPNAYLTNFLETRSTEVKLQIDRGSDYPSHEEVLTAFLSLNLQFVNTLFSLTICETQAEDLIGIYYSFISNISND